MSAARTLYYWLSFHGTWLAVDTGTQMLCHIAPEAAVPPVQLLALAVDGPASALAGETLGGLRIGPGLYPGTFSLRSGAFYASAARTSEVAFTAPQCLGWESFLPVTQSDFLVLQRLEDDGWEGVTRAVLCPKFQLDLGGQTADLRRSLPLPRAGADIWTGCGPDGTPFTLHKTGLARPPEIWIAPRGNMGNRALQYLAAQGLAGRCGGVVRNIDLPEWGLTAPAPPPDPKHAAGTGGNRYQLDSDGLADCLRRGVVQAVRIESFTFHIDHYPPRAEAKALLGPAQGGEDATGFGPDTLVCSIRAGEILHARHHPDYLPLPPAYYQSLADRTGLKLVFHGQLGNDPYSQSLRNAFPVAEFASSRGPGHDFETLRRSVNIVLAISTFSWLAAWLSEAKRIFMPVAGVFNPIQHPDQNFLLLDEPAYEYDLFPYAKAVDLFTAPVRFAAQQRLLASARRPIKSEDLRQIIARGSRLGLGRILTAGFDPDFYTRTAPGAADFIAAGKGPALAHYISTGWYEGRPPLEFDSEFYTITYPDAAMAVAEGRFATPLEHFLKLGYALGYAAKA
jgi:hypothetical protein